MFLLTVLVIIEKFTFKIPRIAQKVERFYKNIVEESLFGKDPDVAEVKTLLNIVFKTFAIIIILSSSVGHD